ncbi:unnamed protein product [Camellia sinensis]
MKEPWVEFLETSSKRQWWELWILRYRRLLVNGHQVYFGYVWIFTDVSMFTNGFWCGLVDSLHFCLWGTLDTLYNPANYVFLCFYEY